MLQWAPEALAGCFPLAAGFVLALSLIMTVLTYAPAPIHTLGITLHSSGSPSANTVGETSGNSSGGSPGGSNPPSSGGTTTTHFTVELGTNNSATQSCATATTALAPLAVSLENSGASSVRWNVTDVDGLSATNTTPWAAVSSATGAVAGGQTATLTLTPNARLCSEIALQGAIYHVLVQVAGAGAFTLVDQVSAPPQLVLALNTTRVSQTCSSFYSALPGVSVALDNTQSNVAANWQLSGIQLIPGTSHPWAGAGAGSGSVAAGQTGTITLTSDPKLCYWSPLPSKTYHATLSWSAGKSGARPSWLVAACRRRA